MAPEWQGLRYEQARAGASGTDDDSRLRLGLAPYLDAAAVHVLDPWEPDEAIPPSSEFSADPWAPAEATDRVDVNLPRSITGITAPAETGENNQNIAPVAKFQEGGAFSDLAGRWIDPWDPDAEADRDVSDACGGAWVIDFFMHEIVATLPLFRGALRRSWFDPAVFETTLDIGPRSKAKNILDLAPPYSTTHRRKLLDRFESVFWEHDDEPFFRKMQQLAEASEDADLLSRAVALKDCWNEAPESWLYRTPKTRSYLQGEPGRAAMSWRLALRLAAARAELDAEDMIDPDWSDDWIQLTREDQGYYAFAQYAGLRAAEIEWENYGRLKSFLLATGHKEDSPRLIAAWHGDRFPNLETGRGHQLNRRALIRQLKRDGYLANAEMK